MIAFLWAISFLQESGYLQCPTRLCPTIVIQKDSSEFIPIQHVQLGLILSVPMVRKYCLLYFIVLSYPDIYFLSYLDMHFSYISSRVHILSYDG